MLAAARRAGNAGGLQHDAGSCGRVRDPGLPRKLRGVPEATVYIGTLIFCNHFLTFIHLYPSMFFLGADLTCYERDRHRGRGGYLATIVLWAVSKDHKHCFHTTIQRLCFESICDKSFSPSLPLSLSISSNRGLLVSPSTPSFRAHRQKDTPRSFTYQLPKLAYGHAYMHTL